jgi:anti-sigma regulatory factor (Ser/Thr protein kinase)
VARLRRSRAGLGRQVALGGCEARVREARRVVGQVLEGGRWAELGEVAQLLVSELATNAIRYGAPPVAITVTIDGDRVEVAVADEEQTPPRSSVGPHDELAESGRGLRLVASMASRWGTRTRPGGKTVWFTLER